MNLSSLGLLYLLKREHSLAIDTFQRALAVNFSSVLAHHWLGLVYAFDRRPEDAVAEQDMATRLSPSDPFLWAFMTVRAHAFLNSGKFEKALEWVLKSLGQPNMARTPFVARVVILSHLDRPAETKAALQELLGVFPDVSIQRVKETFPFKHDTDIRLWEEGLRKAGLAE